MAEEAEPEVKQDSGFLRKIGIAAVIALAFVAVYYFGYRQRMHRYDAFARCLTQKGVKMYGAYWCPHCADQKNLFGASFKYAPYVECGVPGDTRKMQPECTDAGIKHYPTWQFPPVGERVEGEMPLADLSLRTGCPLQ
jgi:hypothetical protein